MSNAHENIDNEIAVNSILQGLGVKSVTPKGGIPQIWKTGDIYQDAKTKEGKAIVDNILKRNKAAVRTKPYKEFSKFISKMLGKDAVKPHTALAKKLGIAPRFAGAPLMGLVAGWELGKMLDEKFDLSDRLSESWYNKKLEKEKWEEEQGKREYGLVEGLIEGLKLPKTKNALNKLFLAINLKALMKNIDNKLLML